MKPKLTLRDLFWLVLVCALAVAWWLDRRSLAYKHQQDLKKQQETLLGQW